MDDLNKYIRKNQLTEIYQALCAGLLVDCPEKPLEWILDKVDVIIEMKLKYIPWDLFICESNRAAAKPISDMFLSEILSFNEPNERLEPDQYVKAYSHFYNRILLQTYQSWRNYFVNKKEKIRRTFEKIETARKYHQHFVLSKYLSKWKSWKIFVTKRHQSGFQIILKVYNLSLSHLIFKSWSAVVADSKKTRDYFERLERGEFDEEADANGTSSSDHLHRDDIALLPRKCSIQIFSNLDLDDLTSCSQVSRSWKIISGAPALWSNINFHKVRHKLSDVTISKIIGKSRAYLLRLNLRHCRVSHLPTFRLIAECKNLQDLNLSECDLVNDEAIKILLEGCQGLLYLNISRTEVSDASIRLLSKHSINLQFLSLAYNNKFTDKGLQYLINGKGCRKLKYLDVSGCHQISARGFYYITNSCRSLQSLLINDSSSLSDESLKLIFENCFKLKMISLINSPQISDVGIKQIRPKPNHLKKILFESNRSISDASIKLLAKQAPQLTHLSFIDCQRISDVTLKALALLRHLVVLNLADCVRVSDSGVRHLVEGVAGLRIRELNLTNCIRVGDVTLLRVTQRCSSLTHLSLRYCDHITDAGFELLASLPHLHHLDLTGTNIRDQGLASLGTNGQIRSLVISECCDVTDLGIQKFCQKVPDLELLDVSNCFDLSDNAVKSLAFCCRYVTHLDLSGCVMLTDLSVQYLAGVCHYVRYLDLSRCIYVSDRALKYLRKGCHQLRSLFLCYCKSITKIGADRMKSHCDVIKWNNDEVPKTLSEINASKKQIDETGEKFAEKIKEFF